MKNVRIVIMWLMFMLPGFTAQVVITYFFRPDSSFSFFVGLPIFILLSIGNLVIYHLFFVPDKIKNQLRNLLFGKQYKNDMEAYEDILTEIIEKAKARQAAYDGYMKRDLMVLLDGSEKAEERFKRLMKIGEWIFYFYLAAIILYNLFGPEFHLNALYVQWGIGLIIGISNYKLGERKRHWGLDAVTLKVCIDKCGDEDRFRFDGEF